MVAVCHRHVLAFPHLGDLEAQQVLQAVSRLDAPDCGRLGLSSRHCSASTQVILKF